MPPHPDPDPAVLAAAGWRYLAERAGVVVLLVDPAQRVRYANAHARELLGPDVAGASLASLFLDFDFGAARSRLAEGPDEPRLVNVSTAAGLPETLYLSVCPVDDDLLLFGQTDAGEQSRLRREVLALNHELANLGRELAQRNAELAETLATVKQLSGLLPICASCKRVRDDKGYWNQIECYIRDHSEATFTHGMCPECQDKFFPGYRKPAGKE